MKRWMIRLAVLPTVVLLCFILLIDPGLLALPATLLAGWWPSAARLAKGWHPSSTEVVLFAMAAILLVAGTHRFLDWIHTARTAAENSVPSPWRWKWTLCGFGVISCTLLAICAMVLTTHQLYWISISRDSLFTDPFRERARVVQLAIDVQKRAQELNWDTEKTRAFFQQHDFMGSGQAAAEAVQVVWIQRDERSLQAIVLIPRRPLNRATARVVVVQPATNPITHRLDELPQLLASFSIGSSETLSADVMPALR